MEDTLDLLRFPLHSLDSQEGEALVARCRADMDRFDMFEMDGLVRRAALRQALDEVAPALEALPPRSPRRHSVYPQPPALPAGHPALTETENSGQTVPGDQLDAPLLRRLHLWPPLAEFLARVLNKPRLWPVAAGPTVSRHAAGEAAGWRFSQAEFKVRLLLQAPQFGGNFEYVRGLRSAADPNPQGVADLLAGRLPVSLERLMPGTLHVLRGRNTAQRLTTVGGDKPRIIAEFAFDEEPEPRGGAERRAAHAF